MSKQLRNLINNSFILVAIRVAGLVFGFLVMLLLARNMPVEEMGAVTIGISLAMILSVILSLNYESGGLKYLSKYLAYDKTKYVASYIKLGNWLIYSIAIFSGFIICCILLLKYFNLQFTPNYVIYSLVGGAIFAWIRVESSYVYSKDHLFLALTPKSLIRHFVFLITVVLLLVLNINLTSSNVMMFFVVSLFFSGLLQWIYRKNIYLQYASVHDDYIVPKKQIFAFCLATILSVLFLELSNDLIIIIASTMISEAEIAILGITLRISGFFLFVVASVNIAINPKLSEAIHTNDIDKVHLLLDMGTLLKLVFAVCGIIFVGYFGSSILSVFGDDYISGTTTLIVFTTSLLVYAVMGPGLLFISLLGLQRILNPVFLSALVLLYGLSYILNQYFGLLGIAYAALIVLIYWNSVLTILVFRKKQYNISAFGTMKRLIKKV